METSALLSTWRSEMNDTAAPYLWSDAEFVTYLDDAQKRWCQETDGIADASTPEVTQLAIVPGTEWYDLHPSIKLLRGITRGDDGRPVSVISYEDMPGLRMRFDGRQGVLKSLITGMQEDRIRAWPVPTETVTLHLLVYRLPLDDLIDVEQPLEIPAAHHLHLLDWVKHRAYLKEDPETFNKSKAEEFEARFLRYCAKAKTEQRRKRHNAGVVAYGGI